jgi:hypothetical protein
MHEVDVYGLFVSPLLAFGVVALPVAFLIRRLLDRLGFYRWVWHRALFDTALYLLVLGGVHAAAGSALGITTFPMMTP